MQMAVVNKATLLQENVSPNVIHNRFDLLYGEDFELYEIDGFYLPVKMDGRRAKLGLYLRKWSTEELDNFTKYLFKKYKKLDELFILHTYTPMEGVDANVHWHIDLPETIEEFDKNLSNKTRYNTKWYPKKIREEVGEYEIKKFAAAEITEDIVKIYLDWKAKSHNYHYWKTPLEYLTEAGITSGYVMSINQEPVAIAFCCETDKNVFFENFSFDKIFEKYSLGMVIYYHFIKDMINQKMQTIYLLGGNLEYKKRYNGIETRTYTSNIMREKSKGFKMLEKFVAYLNKTSLKYKTKRTLLKLAMSFIFKKRNRKKLKAMITNRDLEILCAKRNINFNLIRRETELGFTNPDYNATGPSSEYFIRGALENMEYNSSYNFMDVGSGVGYILYLASLKFDKVLGVEIHPQLAEMSKDNLDKLNVKNYQVINSNVAEVMLPIFLQNR